LAAQPSSNDTVASDPISTKAKVFVRIITP
jgi:hypothetical protein